MELVKTIFKLQFASATRPWLEIRDMLRVAGGDPQRELQASPVLLDQQERRQRVILQVRGVAVELEPLDSSDQSAGTILELVAGMNKASEFPPVAEIEHTCLLVRPYSLPFHQLLSLVKDRWFQSNPLVEAATDVGLSLDEQEGDILKHVQIGPMNAEQLRSQYLIWPREGIPDVFLFIALTCTRTKEEPFKQESVDGLLRSAKEWQAQWVSLILQTLD